MLSTADVAAMAQTSQDTVEREIDRGNLTADKVGRTWVIEAAEARRWAAQFRPYAGLRKQPDSQEDASELQTGQAGAGRRTGVRGDSSGPVNGSVRLAAPWAEPEPDVEEQS